MKNLKYIFVVLVCGFLTYEAQAYDRFNFSESDFSQGDPSKTTIADCYCNCSNDTHGDLANNSTSPQLKTFYLAKPIKDVNGDGAIDCKDNNDLSSQGYTIPGNTTLPCKLKGCNSTT